MAIKTGEKEEEIVVAAAGSALAVGNSNAQRNEDFPDVFYCPLTEKIMVDPVVDTNGESFERNAVTAKDRRDNVTGVIYYPNRALKTIIERELKRKEDKGSLRGKVGESLRSGFDRLAKKSTRPLPDSFYCSITLELIRKPVIDPDGRTFERDAICNWIRTNGTSPVTRNALAVSQLRSNEALRDLIEDEMERTDESIHPSIRRWKMENQTVEAGSTRPVAPPSAPFAPFFGSNEGSIRVFGSNDGRIVDPPTRVHFSNDTGNNQNNPTTQAEVDSRIFVCEGSSCYCNREKPAIAIIISLLFFLVLSARMLRRFL
jgi:hypothetical protein